VLIDTGAQDDAAVRKLMDYLHEFFNGRTDLDRTLQQVILTHPHSDHTKGLREIAEAFEVKRLTHNGQRTGSGWPDVKWVLEHAGMSRPDMKILAVPDSAIPPAAVAPGLTSTHIDPIGAGTNPPACDPAIWILAGRVDAAHGWNAEDLKNVNNQSLVVRVDYGKSSFLLTGDAEAPALARLCDRYSNTSVLDTDVLQVGHHGSHNATTDRLLRAVTPKIAVIPVGRWDYGKEPPREFTTNAYGHPRKVTVDLLTRRIRGRRDAPITAMVATKARMFLRTTVAKRIYATAWDGNVVIRATTRGNLTPETRQ